MLLKQGKSSGNYKKIGFLPGHIAPLKLAFGIIIFLEFPYTENRADKVISGAEYSCLELPGKVV